MLTRHPDRQSMLERMPPPRGTVDLGPADELLAGDRAVVELDGQPVLLLRVRDRIFAVRNRCPHLGRRLDDGVVRRNRLRCRAHGREYTLDTGRCLGRRDRATLLRTYSAWVSDGHVFIKGGK